MSYLHKFITPPVVHIMALELEDRFTNALAAYHSTENPNAEAIAREFSIKYQTFRVRSSKSKFGRPSSNNALEPRKKSHCFYRLIPLIVLFLRLL